MGSAKHYAEKINSKPFKQITKYLYKDNTNDLKYQALLIINKLLTFPKMKKNYNNYYLF